MNGGSRPALRVGRVCRAGLDPPVSLAVAKLPRAAYGMVTERNIRGAHGGWLWKDYEINILF